MLRFIFILLFTSTLALGQSFTEAVKSQRDGFYYIDVPSFPKNDRSKPVGVFDSGTGGLTVFNAIVNFDQHNNQTGLAGGDGIPDFKHEDFIYLADQANMPYGNYSAVGKTSLLNEHILKDAQFMLSNKYYLESSLKLDKKPTKILVIACNTATAYGKEKIESFIADLGLNTKVIGVIDAGVKGALATFAATESGSIGIFATAGTVASNGYVNTLNRLKKEMNYSGNLQYFSVGGVGLAEAVDELPDYIDRNLSQPRKSYRGPSLTDEKLKIDRQLLKIYNFDFENHKMLCDAQKVDDCSELQINSADNYVRYHMVALLENMRKTPNALPLKTLILGCTHYPFMAESIDKVLKELRNYSENGQFRYQHLLAENVTLIDPSVNTAAELYDAMKVENLFNQNGSFSNSEFYISVPNGLNKNIQLDEKGNFTYDYKYGRSEGQNEQFIQNTPFDKSNISKDVYERLSKQIPSVYQLIEQFWATNSKLKAF
jgi:glutamate racemase